jgi:nucleoside-diphosphate-sugar epimerase
MKRVLVTGGSGKLGRACVRDLVEHGLDVFNADTVPSKDNLCPFRQVDFEDMAQTIQVISAMDFGHCRSVDAIVHLAAIPMPGVEPNETVVRINTMTTYNVFEAARRLGIKNIVWASSETLLGLPFDQPPPYFPLDEEYPARPETGYSLSKYLGEGMAGHFCRWDRDLKIACLRFSNVMEPWEYAGFPDFEKDPASRRFNMWGYIDARDGAQAIRKALEAPLKGAEVFIIANADTVMSRPNKDLVAEFYPEVQFKKEVGPNDTLLSIDKARRVLGYEPQHSWRHESNK